MNRKKKRRTIIAITVLVLLIEIVIAIVIASNKSEDQKENNKNVKSVTKIENVSFPEGLQILDSGSFSGTFIEDGTDEIVEEVAALTIKNSSQKWLEYAEIVVSTEDDFFQFSVSALPSGSSARLLEKERKVFGEDEEYNVELKHVVFYEEEPTLNENIFGIDAQNQQIKVVNNSDTDILGDICICYKTKIDNVYLGGIAYRAKIEGGLMAGEEKNCYAGHYMEEVSELLFVTYVE